MSLQELIDSKDLIHSDFCTSCDGRGWRIEKTFNNEILEIEQCEECEEWHRRELRADRLMDEAKGH